MKIKGNMKLQYLMLTMRPDNDNSIVANTKGTENVHA